MIFARYDQVNDQYHIILLWLLQIQLPVMLILLYVAEILKNSMCPGIFQSLLSDMTYSALLTKRCCFICNTEQFIERIFDWFYINSGIITLPHSWVWNFIHRKEAQLFCFNFFNLLYQGHNNDYNQCKKNVF